MIVGVKGVEPLPTDRRGPTEERIPKEYRGSLAIASMEGEEDLERFASSCGEMRRGREGPAIGSSAVSVITSMRWEDLASSFRSKGEVLSILKGIPAV